MARLSPVCWVLLLFLLLRLCAFGGWRLSMWPCCFTWRFCLLHRQKRQKRDSFLAALFFAAVFGGYFRRYQDTLAYPMFWRCLFGRYCVHYWRHSMPRCVYRSCGLRTAVGVTGPPPPDGFCWNVTRPFIYRIPLAGRRLFTNSRQSACRFCARFRH